MLMFLSLIVFDAITAVEELKRLVVVPILVRSTRGRLRSRPAGDVTGRLGRFCGSFGVKGGTEED